MLEKREKKHLKVINTLRPAFTGEFFKKRKKERKNLEYLVDTRQPDNTISLIEGFSR